MQNNILPKNITVAILFAEGVADGDRGRLNFAVLVSLADPLDINREGSRGHRPTN